MRSGPLLQELRAAPTTPLCLAALGLIAWWALDRGGFGVEQWAPGGLALLGLLVVALVAAPNPWRGLPRLVGAAAALLGAYTLWSFASVLWAADPGYALEGASRTVLYLAAFCLFALWPQRPATASLVLAAWIALLGVAGAVLALRLAGSTDPAQFFGDDRLKAPTGYQNATAALLFMPVLPAVVLSAARGIAWWARGAGAGIAVLLSCLALLTVSRGAVYTAPVAVLVLLVLVPGRVRHLLALLPVAAAVVLCAPRLLDVGDAIGADRDPAGAVRDALVLVAVAASAVTLLAASVALLGARRPPSAAMAARLRAGGKVVAVAIVLVALGGGLAVAGDPAQRARSAWTSFKGGYQDNARDKNRLVSGLGSSRYDFYRVSLLAFREHPLLGVGADNFYQQYLRVGRSAETPRYPHSVELRALAQTGLIGAALLLGFLGCATAAAARALRAHGPVGTAAAGGGLLAFAVWLLHGSLDWFWEWAGLGLPAFALLGLACALAPRAQPREPVSRSRPARGAWRRGVPAAAVLVLAAPLVVLWVTDREQRAAVAAFATRPAVAYAHLERAAAWNPFSSAPGTLEGSIALRLGDLPHADAAFGRALARVPDDQYATLERGAIASARGDRRRARELLDRAVTLAPRSGLAREARRVVRTGGTVDVAELNRRILSAAQVLTG